MTTLIVSQLLDKVELGSQSLIWRIDELLKLTYYFERFTDSDSPTPISPSHKRSPTAYHLTYCNIG